MLGKSARGVAVGLAVALVLSCARNVPQDAATGNDGKIKGAKNIQLENGEGKASGIVTYPGGDRIDWKEVDVPEKAIGTLDFKLQWTPPRPGLQLAFDVFDEYNTPIVTSKGSGKRKSRSRVRTATIENAKGKYFVRIYAPGRGDAGKYKLTVDFKEGAGPTTVDWTKVEIPDPPKLPALPEVVEPCDDTNFDIKKPECRNFCPTVNPPKGWPACKGHCPDPPDPTNEACWDKVCPNPPTMRAKACKIKDFPPCDFQNPDPDNPKCQVKADPVTARIIGNQVQGSNVVITMAVGSESAKNMFNDKWNCKVVQGTTPIAGGDVKLVRVDKKATLGSVHLTLDQLENSSVRCTPP
jgi:hypothetical protein